MFRKLLEPCGLHCIRINDIGVTVGEQEILKNVNLHIHCGTLAAVIGKNGAGKSTLIRAILGDIPHTGSIEFSLSSHHHAETHIPDTDSVRNPGEETAHPDRKDIAAEQEATVLPDGKGMELKIGYVPQSLNIEKKTPISVYDMIACYQSRYPVFWKKSKSLNEKIRENLSVFQAEDLIDRQVCNLSGGELQRVLLSMAIMDQPDLLLLDEPVSGIDQNGMDVFYQTISDLKKNYDLAIILISHDLDYVAKYADQVILIDEKTVACQGSVRKVYESEAFARVFGTRRDGS
ncbi:MAG: metal ABC transporter ATP-binding protein [Clostridiales bacterium]|nr:metal ABC transporter ATP-binding protein [Clostridiales bacterium]